MTSKVSGRLILLTALLLLGSQAAYAQERDYTLALRGVALDEALQRFVNATGAAVSYDPKLVEGRKASCAAESVPTEAVLRCILAETGLDFYRLSSGTYVVTERVEVAPARGYLAGRVIDYETGRPLAGSHVQLADAGLGTVTNQSGRFTFPALLPGRYAITVSHLGYRAWQDSLVVAPREQVQTEAALRSETIFITPVVIDGLQPSPAHAIGHAAATAAAAPVGLSADVSHSTYRRLRAVPGVRLNDVTADIHLQGGDPGAHQLRLDGVPVFLPHQVAGVAGPFAAFALDRITVKKAGFGASHGSQLSGFLLGEHALAATNDVDVQADPYSLNARVRLSPQGPEAFESAAMIAARVGLWDVFTTSSLRETLDGWSRPDPFLILGPIEQPGLPAQFEIPTSLLRAPVNPTLHFYDLHAAARLRFGPLRSLHASVYEGRQQLTGGILSGGGAPLDYSAGIGSTFTVEDDYGWINRLGQIRYEAVLGSRTLANVQLRASSYRLQHQYERLDSLHVILANDVASVSSLSTTPVEDGNTVSMLALEGTLDHAYGPHHLQTGVEGGIYRSRFDLRSVHFSASPGAVELADALQNYGRAEVEHSQGSVRSSSDTWYLATFAEDRVSLAPRLEAELGVRLTYLHARETVYAEPRAALQYGEAKSSIGPWSARLSGGLYRQFLSRSDASKLNAGALLPTVRIWLPIDATVRPPISYHVSQELLLEPDPEWKIRLEGFAKYTPHVLTLGYAPVDRSELLTGAVRQSEFLAGTREYAYGGNVSLSWESTFVRAEVRYAYTQAQRRSRILFDGRRHPVPWHEPHRLELAVDWMPSDRLAFNLRWQGVWERPWGFRRIYYDYFGHSSTTRHHPPYDFGDPSAHRLPPLYQLDVSAAYTIPVGAAVLQLRAEVINVLDRSNVIDWRLVRDGDGWRKEARTLYPMMPALAARLSL